MLEKFFKNKKMVIVTHNGRFHADECFAVATVLLHLGKEPSQVEIVRSRKQEDWDRGDFVIDVGGVYNPEKNRFDHHQKEGAGKRENGIPYGAFGLVWKEFGVKICAEEELAKKIDNELVVSIDANDNGVAISEPIFPAIFPYSFPEFVNTSNLSFKDDREKEDEKFVETMLFLKTVLERKIRFLKDEKEARKEIVRQYNAASDKRIVVLDKNYPWENVLSEFSEPLFCVWHRSDGSWAVKCVRDNTSQFVNRKNLPQEWAGRFDKELQEITGVSDAIFCHNACFMAAAETKEGAIELAKLALK